MRYVDGYVLAVPKKNLKAYRRMASMAGKIWMEHGAVQYCECTGEDLNVKCGLPFPKLMKLKKGETAVFAWIVFKSRKHRDAVNKKVINDSRLKPPKKMPFDMKRMAYGGFETLVDL